MVWTKVSDNAPTTYMTGDFDGKKSDDVLVVMPDGSIKIAALYAGTMDGHDFMEWTDDRLYIMDETPVYWMKIPNAPF